MGIEIWVDALSIAVSLFALVYWVRLFKRIHLESRDSGWLWIFSSVLMVLLLNLSTLTLSILSGRMPVGQDLVFVADRITFDFVSAFSRFVMALAISIGTYMLFRSMSNQKNVKYVFTPLMLEPETERPDERKYELSQGKSYLVIEGTPANTIREYYLQRRRSLVKGIDIFVDQVTHGMPGMLVTREFPPRIRRDHGLVKTPMFWLTKEKDYDESIHPADITELSHITKSFMQEGGQTIVLLEGTEYLISHNSFEEILRLVQGLHDVAAKMDCILLITLDPSTLTKQQYSILSRSLTVFKMQQ